MSYQLNKSDGTILTDLIDGQIDNTSTNLVLVGRNYTGYGEFFNENFIKLLENFANSAAPSNPLAGQVWWDTAEQRLKVFDGNVWKASGGPYVQDTRPQMVAGDLWIDNLNNQLYAFDGSDLILVGPIYTQSQGLSGFRIESILDSQSRSRTVASLYIGGSLVGVFSNVQFTPEFSRRIPGLVTDQNPTGIIYEGFNVINSTSFQYRGIASSANGLVTATGTVRTAESFLPSNANGITTGTLTIQNSGGLTIGLSQNHVQKVVGQRFYLENQLRDHDLSLRVRSSAFESLVVDAIYVDASTARVGIFTTNRLPEYTLDVAGDLRVTGNLLVEGETTSIDVATLRVEDKNIELGKTSAGVVLDQLAADNAGLLLDITEAGIPRQKSWTWKSITNAWTTNVNLDLSDNTKSISIGGEVKLTNDSLTNIRFADNLERIGTLIELQVDDININGNNISSNSGILINSAAGITVQASGAITLSTSQQIKGLANPTNNQDAATKIYVDTEVANETIIFSMDITGLGVGATLNNRIAGFLNDMYPPIALNNGKICRIHTTSYSGALVSGVDIEGIKNISRIAVDSAGTQNEIVVQDIVFDPEGASGNVTLVPTRSLMVFSCNGTTWTHVSTTAYL
jgi:hypothetical protein